MKPRPTVERVWYAYLAAVLVVAATATDGFVPSADRWAHLGVHVGVFAAVLGVHQVVRRRSAPSPNEGRGTAVEVDVGRRCGDAVLRTRRCSGACAESL